ncbi:vanadium-dependent haloperoxidase [Serpentinicella alkaliphila]|uniref:PAP2 superfamily protein n=1 Tax=Serpentinicella alkaliphila TaxID=1734049 RepID=A0A4V2T4Z6_9FIRM|nr:vanadium-dependent haloperoxidase [Serpentinicella alkaliphila]QUH25252.1 vanadium-dependent haloperoxidase [Serpentinicella alkaliphila]TCQ07064.1 PAP2 superfamily protein [Serpentinicella alkaliphila]
MMNYSNGSLEDMIATVEDKKVSRKNNRKNRIKRPMKKWYQLPYAGETERPKGIDPAAGSWPLYYIRRNRKGQFISSDGKLIKFDIENPDNIDFCKELALVKKTLRNVTKHQKVIADYWGDGPATKQWTPIIDRLVDTYNLSPAQSARVIAAVQAGINDAFVVTWYFKYLWEIPRPNQLDHNLLTVICTPKFPAYPSGHSVISGTAEVILSYFFPTEAEKLKELAEENSISRLYGGVHFLADINEGLRLGRQIGRIIVDILRGQFDSNGKLIYEPVLKPLHAELNPPPYEQVIPYTPRARLCDLPLLPE